MNIVPTRRPGDRAIITRVPAPPSAAGSKQMTSPVRSPFNLHQRVQMSRRRVRRMTGGPLKEVMVRILRAIEVRVRPPAPDTLKPRSPWVR